MTTIHHTLDQFQAHHPDWSYQWDERFIEMAQLVSTWSKDPSTKCGAVIVRPDKTVVSVGFNGFPKGCDDDPEIYANRDLKLSRVVHAELNAIIHAREPLNGYTMYTYPPGYGPSCDRCTAHIVQSGITRVVHVKDESDFASRWKEPAERGLQMYKEAGVEVIAL
jgi:dCMP deaminase